MINPSKLPLLSRYLFVSAIFIFWLIAVPNFNGRATADDRNDALQAAQNVNSELDANNLNQIYDHSCDLIRSQVTKAAFVSQLSISRSTFGGASKTSSTIMESNNLDPASHRPVRQFRFLVQYPAALVYEDLTMFKDTSDAWKLCGIYFYPAPPGAASE